MGEAPRQGHPYRTLSAAADAPLTPRAVYGFFRMMKPANAALRRALLYGELRDERASDVRALADRLSTAIDTLADLVARIRIIGTTQAAFGAILSAAGSRWSSSALGYVLFGLGAGLAVMGAVFAIYASLWAHEVERFGKTLEELRRYCNALPDTERRRVDVSEARASVKQVAESIAEKDRGRKKRR